MGGTINGPKDLHVKQSRLLRDRRLRVWVPDEIPVTVFQSLLRRGRIRRGNILWCRKYAAGLAAITFLQNPCALEFVLNLVRHICRDLSNARPPHGASSLGKQHLLAYVDAYLIFRREFGAHTSRCIPKNVVPTTRGNIVGELIWYEGTTRCDGTGRHIHLPIWTESAAACAGEQAEPQSNVLRHTRGASGACAYNVGQSNTRSNTQSTSDL